MISGVGEAQRARGRISRKPTLPSAIMAQKVRFPAAWQHAPRSALPAQPSKLLTLNRRGPENKKIPTKHQGHRFFVCHVSCIHVNRVEKIIAFRLPPYVPHLCMFFFSSLSQCECFALPFSRFLSRSPRNRRIGYWRSRHQNKSLMHSWYFGPPRP